MLTCRRLWLSVVHQGDADSLVWGIVALVARALPQRSLRSSSLSADGALPVAEFEQNSATFGCPVGIVVRGTG